MRIFLRFIILTDLVYGKLYRRPWHFHAFSLLVQKYRAFLQDVPGILIYIYIFYICINPIPLILNTKKETLFNGGFAHFRSHLGCVSFADTGGMGFIAIINK